MEVGYEDIENIPQLIKASSKDEHLIIDEYVELSTEQYIKLCTKFNVTQVTNKIFDFTTFLHNNESNRKKYKDHYRTLMNWCRRDWQGKVY